MQKEQHTFISASLFPLLFLLFAWAIYYYDAKYTLNLYRLGVSPRNTFGIIGVLFMPLLHGDIHHILSNTFPFLILGILLFYYYKDVAFKVFIYIYLFSGFLVWLLGDLEFTRSGHISHHIGASGIIYGLSGFLFFSGIIRKHRALFGVSLLVTFLYGTIIWGIFPEEFQKAMHILREKENISWEGHLFGFMSGTVLAFVYRKQGIQRPEYSWEINNDADIDESNPYWMVDENGNSLNPFDNSNFEDGGEIIKQDSDNPYTVNYTFVPKKKLDEDKNTQE